jgi:hypothetical protein
MKVISTHNFASSSGSGTVINYGSGSGSDFLTSYGSGSGSTSQKVTVPTVLVPVPVPQHWDPVVQGLHLRFLRLICLKPRLMILRYGQPKKYLSSDHEKWFRSFFREIWFVVSIRHKPYS